jgi:ribosomal protein L11 methyltransferase
MYWIEISVVTDGEAAEAVADFLRPFAYGEGEGVVLEQLGDENSSDPLALMEDIAVKIYISSDIDSSKLRRKIEEGLFYLGRLYPIPAPTYRKLEDKDWAYSWRENFRPFRVGRRVWIYPSWIERKSVQLNDIVLVLDPGMAFGTGTHPSTQMCLEILEVLVKNNYTMLDVGSGSGILAIASVKLGASQVTALDIDGLAARATLENARRNKVASRVHIFQGNLLALSRKNYDLVVVNILAPVIVDLLGQQDLLHYVADAGRLVLSGVIETQFDEVKSAVETAGGEVEQTLATGDWRTLVAKKNVIAE